MNKMSILGEIKILMEERGWSNQELARRAGLSRSTVANMFRRETTPTPFTLEALANAFGISPVQFFGFNGSVGELSSEQQHFLSEWEALTDEQKRIVTEVVRQFHRARP